MVIPKLHARTAASNALGATNGSAPQVKQKSVQNMDLNILAPARGMPVAQEKPVTENILPVLAHLHIFGVMETVLVAIHINILVQVLSKVRQVLPAIKNIKAVAVLVTIIGVTEVVSKDVLHLIGGMVHNVVVINICILKLVPVNMKREGKERLVMENIGIVLAKVVIDGIVINVY